MTSELPSNRPPRLSVVWAGKNRVSSIKAAIASVLAQDEQDFEIVVEDGGSTDGTLEILRHHADMDARIDVVSRPAASANQRLLNGLRRCRGDIVALCPETGRFLPDAMAIALEELRRIPDADALLCGRQGAFDIVSLLFSREQPELGNILLRRRCLLDLGLDGGDWAIDCPDFDLLRRLAADGELRRSAATIAIAGPPVEYSGRSANREVCRHLTARLDLVDRLFAGTSSPVGASDALEADGRRRPCFDRHQRHHLAGIDLRSRRDRRRKRGHGRHRRARHLRGQPRQEIAAIAREAVRCGRKGPISGKFGWRPASRNSISTGPQNGPSEREWK